MDQRLVEELEAAIQESIAAAFKQVKRLPLKPTKRTLHMMAKAAVAVYEAVDNRASKS
jgi:hypothetical protein